MAEGQDYNHPIKVEPRDEDEPSNSNGYRFCPVVKIIQPYMPNNEQAFEFYNSHNVSEESRKIMQSGQDGYHPLKSTFSSFPLEPFVKWIKGGADKIIQSVISSSGRDNNARVNQLIISIGTNHFYHLFYDGFVTPGSDENMDVLWRNAHGPTPLIMPFCHGVFGTHKTTLGNEKCIDLQIGDLPVLSTLQIPTVPGLTIVPFVVTRRQNQLLEATNGMGMFQEILGITNENQNQLQGIVFYHKYFPQYRKSSLRSPIVKYLQMYLQANRHVYMAGGVSCYLMYKGTTDFDVVASGFLVIGNPETVKVSCAFLEDPGLPMENINKLKKLSTRFPTEIGYMVSSFGLIFGSMTRGKSMYGSPGLEANYLTNLVPSTKMIGAYTEKRFCSEKLNTGNIQTIEASNATAFILIAYKHPISSV